MKNSILLIPVLFILMASMLTAQNPVIKALQNKFNSISNLSADFSQSSIMSNHGKSISTKGRLFYQKEDKYRIELKNQELISDGTTFWNYNKRNNKVIINELKNESSTFSFKKILQEYPAKSKVESLGQDQVNGIKLNLVRLTPKDNGDNFRSIRIWSDGDGLIRRIEINDNSGLTNLFEFSNIKINQGIPSNKFNFEPPKGSEVVDLR